MRNALVAVMSLFVFGGCAVNPTGMNSQRAGVRSLGDTSVTVAIDSVKSDVDAEAVKTKVREIALAVQLFLKDGKLADLTVPEFTEVLRKIVPVDYQFLLDIMIAQIQGVTVNVGKIGQNNIERINSVCVGLINGCNYYDMKYRPIVVPAVAAAEVSSAGPVASDTTDKSKAVVSKRAVSATAVSKFGVRLKKEYGVK